MRQNITKEQFDELNDTLKDKALKVFGFGYEYINIGTMIEFLDESINKSLGESWYGLLFNGGDENDGSAGTVYQNYEGELCDALWEAVKQILEEKS